MERTQTPHRRAATLARWPRTALARQPRGARGIGWIVRAGAQWADLPERYPPYSTCHRRFPREVREDALERGLEAPACDLNERGTLDLPANFIRDTLVVI
jgi:transposase